MAAFDEEGASPAVDTARVHTIEKSHRKLLMMAAVSLIFVVGGIWLVIGNIEGSRRGVSAEQAGWLSIVFCGACLLGILKELFQGERAVMTLSPTGFRDTRLSAQEIAWAIVRELRETSVKGQRFIAVSLDPEAEGSIKLRSMARWARKVNAAFCDDALWVSSHGIKTDFDTLMRLMCAYWTAHSRACPAK